ncbi:MAG TPA: hypothetical protein PKM51_05930 [Chitinophagales bacterium]|nr:hypothetical protein [Chitinophagales bacterium]HNM32268.1 hypothetical protein [Chitinophagales bacterium]
MMELEDLKNIWKDKIDEDINAKHIAQAQISTLLNQRSTSIIDKLRKNLLWEIVGFCLCLFIVICIPFFFPTITIVFLCVTIVAVVFLPYLVYYVKKYRELQQFSSYHQDLKTNLTQLILQMEKYLKIYFWGSLLLTPLTVFLSGFIILYEIKALGFLLYFDTFHPSILSTLLSLALLITLISYPTMKWYIRKMYGRHLEKLKKCLQEIEEIQEVD